MKYDYVNQAWTRDGVYVDCNHPAAGTLMGPDSIAPGEEFGGCDCYGRVSAKVIADWVRSGQLQPPKTYGLSKQFVDDMVESWGVEEE
jgi:hypothetical protein